MAKFIRIGDDALINLDQVTGFGWDADAISVVLISASGGQSYIPIEDLYAPDFDTFARVTETIANGGDATW